jgi:hypothetical protein
VRDAASRRGEEAVVRDAASRDFSGRVMQERRGSGRSEEAVVRDAASGGFSGRVMNHDQESVVRGATSLGLCNRGSAPQKFGVLDAEGWDCRSSRGCGAF